MILPQGWPHHEDLRQQRQAALRFEDQGGQLITRKRSVHGAAGIGAAALALVLAACSPQISDGTALTAPDTHGWSVAEQTGSIFTDGFETVEPTVGPIVIERVVAAGGSDDVRLVGVKVAGPDRELGSVQFSDGFPPTSHRTSARYRSATFPTR
ncbi:MAG TPA: hypothetical protein VGK53_04915 [Propionicimonas sp.]